MQHNAADAKHILIICVGQRANILSRQILKQTGRFWILGWIKAPGLFEVVGSNPTPPKIFGLNFWLSW